MSTFPDSGVSVGGGERVPTTGCASGDIMWLLDDPNQPYEGNFITIISFLILKWFSLNVTKYLYF